MFVVNPGPQAVLRTITDKEHYFAVRRLFGIDLKPEVCDVEVLCQDSLFTVGLKETPTLTVSTEHSLRACSALIIALKKDLFQVQVSDVADVIYGWGAGIIVDCGDKLTQLNMPIAASALRPAGMAADIASSDMWLYVNNHNVAKIDFKHIEPGIFEAIAQLAQSVHFKAGDALMLKVDGTAVEITPGDRVRSGVTGVGMLTVCIQK